MQYLDFHMSRIGASHERYGLPCQDVSDAWGNDVLSVAVVADGHGSRRHFRSGEGARLACEVLRNQVTELPECVEAAGMEEMLCRLKQSLCTQWRDAVREHAVRNPWTEAELAGVQQVLTEAQFQRLMDGTDDLIPYGSTLCAVFAWENMWAAIQLGDGGMAMVDSEGLYTWPMPESLVNEGNRTASLCMADPMVDFRHCFGTGRPAGLFVYTDGIEKTLPPQSPELASLLNWMLKNTHTASPAREQNLTRTLDMLTSRSLSGDDVSAAGLADPAQEVHDVQISPEAQQRAFVRLRARLEEIEVTLEYNRQKLEASRPDHEGYDTGTVRQLETIVMRKEQEKKQLLELMEPIREACGSVQTGRSGAEDPETRKVME